MSWLYGFAREVALLFVEATPWLLVGFLLAGLLKVLVPASLIYRQLGARGLKSVVLAAIYGTPIPLCSCSVIPTATALKKAGASRGATTSFLISTPETGVDSISVTWALLDPLMTVVRPVAAFVTAVVTGGLVNLFDRSGSDPGGAAGTPSPAEDDCCEAQDHEHEVDWDSDELQRRPLGERLRLAVRYAFGPLLDDLTPWFVLGFLVSGVIAAVVPEGFFGEVVPRGWPAMLLMMVLGAPMYICATASTPVAAALIAKGLEPGAALVFLLVGPATNVTTLFVVSGLLGRRALALYLAGIAGLALVFGALVDLAYHELGIDLSARVAETLGRGPSPWAIAAALGFALLLLGSARRIGLWSQWANALDRVLGPLGVRVTPARLAAAPAALALVAWGATAVTVVQPGQVAFRTRFGRVVETWSGAGLRWHAPVPFERVVRSRPEQVEGLSLGFDPRPPGPGEDPREAAARERRRIEDEAEILAGDENLLSVSFAVHYRARDAFRARFGVVDPGALVRGLSEAAVRGVLARRSSAEILVGSRHELEEAATRALQADLDAVQSGIEVVGVFLHDVHAPVEVHPAYRDVASALEDQERALHEAEGYSASQLAGARAGAARRELQAQGEARGEVDRAAGEAAAFSLLAQAYHESPELTRLRLWLGAVEKALDDARVVLLLGDDVDVEVLDLEGGRREPAVLTGEDGER